MNNTDILSLELRAAEQEARDILTKEGIDPAKIERQFFSGWPGTKVGFVDIGYLNPKLSDFREAAHYAYRMIGTVGLIREMLKECKDDEELRRMIYMLNLGQFKTTTEVGLNEPRARKFLKRESAQAGGKAKKGKHGPVRKLIEAIIKDLQVEGQSVKNRVIKDRLKDRKYCSKFSDFENITYDLEEQTLSFIIPTDRGDSGYEIKLSTLSKIISELKPK